MPWTIFRVAVRVLLGIVIVIALLVAIAVVAVQSPWGRDYLRRMAEQRAEALLDAEVTIGHLSGSLFSDATVDNLTITRRGEPAVSADRVRVDYSALELARGHLGIARIALDGLTIRADAIGGLLPQNRRSSGRSRSFSIDALILRNGTVVIGPQPAQVDGFRVPDVIRRLDAELSLQAGPRGTSVGLTRLSFVGEAPAVTVHSLSGAVRITDDDLFLENIRARLEESSFEFSATIENFRQLGAHDEENGASSRSATDPDDDR